jgi:hypothetical protein
MNPHRELRLLLHKYQHKKPPWFWICRYETVSEDCLKLIGNNKEI